MSWPGPLYLLDTHITSGVIRGNRPFFTGSSVKNYLTRGAKREDRLQYPNRDWGFGRLDLYHTFELLT